MTTRVTLPVVRDTIQWVIGTWIGVNETIIRQLEPRWEVLVFAGVLMGVPAITGLLSLKQRADASRPDAPTTSSQSSSH